MHLDKAISSVSSSRGAALGAYARPRPMAGVKGVHLTMTSKFKVLMVSLGALLAFSMVGVGVARAGQPIQPLFTSAGATGVVGETVKSALTIEDQSGASRLWSTNKEIVITCQRSTSLGKIEPNGQASAAVLYKECAVYPAAKNSSKQWQEGKQLECTIKNLNPELAKENEIQTKPLRSKLVWGKAGTEGAGKVFDQYEPEGSSLFAEFEFKGAGCILKAIKIKVIGTVLGLVPRTDQEGVVGANHFEVINPGTFGEVRQHFTQWECQAPGASTQEAGTDELLLVEGTKFTQSALESTVQYELSKVNEKRQPWGVRTK